MIHVSVSVVLQRRDPGYCCVRYCMCENNEIYKKKKEGKNAFHNAFHVPNFFCFPGKTGIPTIKDLKDVLGVVCYVFSDVQCV